MADFHFVEDYERHVAALIASYPIDEAMSLAVGGFYDEYGKIEFEILRHLGLKPGHHLLDFGCGSGRLAFATSMSIEVNYLGVDVVQALLDYAKTKCPSNYRFILNRRLTLPVDDNSLDLCCSFSVFTHLLHQETYIYLEEMFRGLRSGGKVVCSFLEFYAPAHWAMFSGTLEDYRKGGNPLLNQFIERSQLTAWAHKIGYSSTSYIDGGDAPWPSGQALGQSIAILTK